MPYDSDSLDMILALIKQLEATLIGLKQLRGYVAQGAGSQTLEVLIREADVRLSEIKQKLIQ